MKPFRLKATKQTFTVRVTRSEFLELPMKIRRRALKEQVDRFLAQSIKRKL